MEQLFFLFGFLPMVRLVLLALKFQGINE